MQATHTIAERKKMKPLKFSVNHVGDSSFESGLRSFFDYRDLGIRDATGGLLGAHVIRATPGTQAVPQRHHHEVQFQMVYVLKGWIKFHYEGVGEVTLKAGSCVHQPPAIRHTELGHSDDVEMIEIIMPADFKTEDD
jgi:mannose-6-phosphate isomerase-like protein (cupin superfamily)